MKEEIEHNFFCVISQKDEYLIFLNTINARVVVVAQLVERRY